MCRPVPERRIGFTVIELLVAIAIVSLLIAMLLPAIQMAREAARRAECRNNLKQLAIALHNYSELNGAYPMSCVVTTSFGGSSVFGGWSVHARLLPFIEQGRGYSAINFAFDYEHATNRTVAAQNIGLFTCPSELNDRPAQHSFGFAGVTTYGWNMGDWYVWGGTTYATPPRGAFYVNSRLREGDFVDGLSNTLVAAEVKAYQRYYRDCGGLSAKFTPYSYPGPADDPYTVAVEYVNGAGCAGGLKDSGHTEWMDGGVHQTGMTTAWTPNRRTQNSQGFDVDLTGIREKNLGPTFSAITARSYHAGGVNALIGDGSVRFVSDSIDGPTWRAFGTISGGEAVDEF